MKKASSDKGLEETQTSERSKGGGESEAASGGAGANRMNRMSYPTTAAKGPLRRKRSSSRLAGNTKPLTLPEAFTVLLHIRLVISAAHSVVCSNMSLSKNVVIDPTRIFFRVII